jgi:hypothetical protein
VLPSLVVEMEVPCLEVIVAIPLRRDVKRSLIVGVEILAYLLEYIIAGGVVT